MTTPNANHIHTVTWIRLGICLVCFCFISSEVAVAQLATQSDRQRGIELLNQRKFKDAAKVFRKALDEDRRDADSWYYLGLALIKQEKEISNAAKAFEAALNRRPDFVAARIGLAYALLAKNKLPEAMREAQAVVIDHPAMADAHYIIGVVRLRSGAHDEALIEAEEAIKLDPQLASSYLLKSQVVLNGDRRSSSTAAPIPQVGSEPTPEERIAMRNKRKEGSARFIQAAESLETYLRLNPYDSAAEVWREQLATLKVFARYGEDTPDPKDAVFSAREVTTRVHVLAKPEPVYTESARREGVSGTVVFRTVFAADGAVRHILVLQGLPNGLTAQAIKAIRRIRFVPATLNGQPVSMFVQLEYDFNLY